MFSGTTCKTGTLTENRMRVTWLWVLGAEHETTDVVQDPRAQLLASTAAACTTAEVPSDAQPAGSGDPTELALLRLAADLSVGVHPPGRTAARRTVFHFDAHLKRMSTVDAEVRTGGADPAVGVHTKGARRAC